MLLAALLMTASCTVGPDNAPEEPETPVEEPGANPGDGGGGGSAGGGSTSSSKEQAAKEFLIGFEPRSFISEGLQAAMEGGDATATIKWNEPEEEVPSSNAAAGPEAGTRQFTVAFTKYNHNDSEVSGDVRYEITLDGTAIQGYKVISSTNLKADGNDISIAFGEDTDPIEAAGMISEDANGKINFADVKVMPVPMGTVVEIKVNDSPTIELDDIFSDIPAVEPTLDDLPGDLNAIRKSIGSLNAYIITRIAEIGNSTGTFPILDVDDVDQEDAYFVVDTYTASNQMTGATAVQPYVSAVHVGVPIDFSIAGDHVYLSGAIDMKTDMSAMSATTEFSDFGAMFIDEEDGSVMMADHLDGMLDESWLSTLNKGGTRLPSHADMTKTPGIDFTAGSLGQGFSAAVGIALAQRMRKLDSYTYVVVGDGESQEGEVWEAAEAAGAWKLGNLIGFTDLNGQQLDDYTDNIIPMHDLKKRYETYGWEALEIDGHDFSAIEAAIAKAKSIKDKPVMIIMHTIKSYGYIPGEGIRANHSMQIDKSKAEEAIAALIKREEARK